MKKKFFILIIFNILSFICYKIANNSTKIKSNYEKWKQFYDKYKFAPFKYIENLLPFSPDYLFLKISNFETKLSIFIKNIGYTLDNYDEDETEIDPLFNNITIINKTNFILPVIDTNYDNYFDIAIDEMNILDDSFENKNKLNLKPILQKGLNRNKIILLFIFFIQQLHIFQNIKQKIDLNRIYLQGKNKTKIEDLEITYEILFDYENIHELFSLSNQFIEYHKDYGFFVFEDLKKENVPKLSKSEKRMINLIINLRNKNSEDYNTLNEFDIAYFLNIFERTVNSLNCLGMANSLYKKGIIYYKRDIHTLQIGFIAFTIFINLLIMIHYDDSDDNNIKEIRRKKKYKYN